MSADTSRGRVRALLVGITLLGAALRVWAAAWDSPLHPDEYFQYLEPAWWHLTGAGSETWEWRDGLRSWVLPFYNGAWIALLRLCQVERGSLVEGFVRAHWALLNTSVVVIAYRAGRALNVKLAPTGDGEAGAFGGLIAAALCAAFPALVLYAGHTLSEMPSMLCLLAGLMLICELSTPGMVSEARLLPQAAWAGTFLSLGACLRIANGPLVLVPTALLLATRRYRALGIMVAFALPPFLIFALVDRLTWGGFASSFVAYLKFNFIEGGAARFGREAPLWYLEQLHQSAPLALPLLGISALLGLRASWPYLLSGLGMLVYLSTQPHKELRFIIGFWPLLLIAAGGTLGAWVTTASNARGTCRRAAWRTRVIQAACLAWMMLTLLDGLRHVRTDRWLDRERLEGVSWVGSQPDLTGFMIDDAYAVSGPGFGSVAPKLQYDRALLGNAMISHVLVPLGSEAMRETEGADFEIARRLGTKYVILRRRLR